MKKRRPNAWIANWERHLTRCPRCARGVRFQCDRGKELRDKALCELMVMEYPSLAPTPSGDTGVG